MLTKKLTILKRKIEAKEENQILREQTESELRERRELQRQETRLLQKKRLGSKI